MKAGKIGVFWNGVAGTGTTSDAARLSQPHFDSVSGMWTSSDF
jgi:hypothetical protein